MKILVGTKNEGKIEGVKRAFEKYFDNVCVEGIAVESEVLAQPVNEEILLGAKNRVKNLKKYAKSNFIKADYFVATEGGITNFFESYVDINIAVVENSDGYQSIGISQGFPIPDKYVDKIIKTELGTVMDELLHGNNLAKGKGGISYLTKDEVSRIDMTENACIMALTMHINGKLWK